MSAIFPQTNPGPRTDAALLVLRVTLAVVMIAHGWQKWTSGGFGGVSESFSQMFPGGAVVGPLIMLLELGGGVLLLVGVATPIVAGLMAVTMLGAMLMVHVPNGFYAADGGIEFTLLLTIVSAFIAIVGPGRFSVDHRLASRFTQTTTREPVSV